MKKQMGGVASLMVLAVMVGTGCKTPIRYDLEHVHKPRPDSQRQAVKLAIAQFQDLRPEQEKAYTNQAYGLAPSHVVTQDQFFKDGNVSKGISEALAAHFNHVQLFNATALTNAALSIPSEDAIHEVHELGYDALMTGNLVHFCGVGYYTGLDKFTLVVARIPILGLAFLPFAMMQGNNNHGYVELADVQLIDTSSGKAIWTGSYAKQMEHRFYDAIPARAANETLREVVNEMVMQVEKAEFKELMMSEASNTPNPQPSAMASQETGD